MDNLAVLLIGTSFTARFVKGILQMKHGMVPIPSLPIAMFSEYTPTRDLMAALHTYSDAKSNTDDRKDRNNKTLLFGLTKCLTAPPNTEATVSAMTSSTRLIHTVFQKTGEKYRVVHLGFEGSLKSHLQ